MRGIAYDTSLDLFAIAGGDSTPDVFIASGSAVAGGSPTFVQQTLGGSNIIRAIASRDDGEFSVVGSAGETHISLNGTTWLLGTPVFGTPVLRAVSYGEIVATAARAIAVGTSKIARQDAQGDPDFTGQVDPAEILWAVVCDIGGSEVWIIAGAQGANGAVIRSTDGSAFGAPTVEFTTRIPRDVDHANAQFVLVTQVNTQGGSGNQANIATSPDGLTGNWTVQAVGNAFEDLFAVKHLTGTIWVAGGLNGRIFLSADDAVSWTPIVTSIPSTPVVGFAYSTTHSIAALVATDGSVWTSREITQSDPPPSSIPPTSTEPLVANNRLAQQAINRLAGQFRSGAGEPE
jgi:hypothetical protein